MGALRVIIGRGGEGVSGRTIGLREGGGRGGWTYVLWEEVLELGAGEVGQRGPVDCTWRGRGLERVCVRARKIGGRDRSNRPRRDVLVRRECARWEDVVAPDLVVRADNTVGHRVRYDLGRRRCALYCCLPNRSPPNELPGLARDFTNGKRPGDGEENIRRPLSVSQVRTHSDRSRQVAQPLKDRIGPAGSRRTNLTPTRGRPAAERIVVSSGCPSRAAIVRAS